MIDVTGFDLFRRWVEIMDQKGLDSTPHLNQGNKVDVIDQEILNKLFLEYEAVTQDDKSDLVFWLKDKQKRVWLSSLMA